MNSKCILGSPIVRHLVISCGIALVATSFVSAAEKLRIGVSVPLTGTAAAYGTDIRNALIFANEKLANSAYELVIEDDQCSDREAVTVAHKLVDVHKVKYVLGFGCSGTVLSSASVYESAKVIVIASGTGAPAISKAGDYIFRTKPTLGIAGEVLAREMSQRFKKVGALTEETAYCQGLTDAVRGPAEKSGVEIMQENYLAQTEDFRSMLLRLKNKGAQAVFLNSQGEPGMVTLFRQFTAMSWKVPVFGTFHPGSPVFRSAFGDAADGVVYADLPFNSAMLNADGMKLFADFEEKYGKVKSAEHFAALTFVAFAALHEAIESGKDVKTFLYGHTFRTMVDGFSFDANGDVVSEKLTYVLKTLKNGEAVPYSRNEA